MTSQKFDLRKLVKDKIAQFARTYSIRKKVFEQNTDRKEQQDRERLLVIWYHPSNKDETNFYGVLSEKICYCGCGAGHLNLAVLSIKNPNRVNEATLDIERYMDNRYGRYGRDSQFAKDILFEILTYRVGTRIDGSWPEGFEISGLEVPDNSCVSLIRDLTQET